MTREVKLQIGVAFLSGIILGMAGIIVGGTCIACKNSKAIEAARWHIDALDKCSTQLHKRILILEGQ